MSHYAETVLLSPLCFFALAEYMIKNKNSGYYFMTCLNINNFEIINDKYGKTKQFVCTICTVSDISDRSGTIITFEGAYETDGKTQNTRCVQGTGKDKNE